MTPLLWTKEPPTEPGWYWAEWDKCAEAVRVIRRDGVLVAGDECCSLPLSDYERWAGPIPQPAEPTEAEG